MSAFELPEGYEITPCGRVISVGSNWRGYGAREMTQRPNEDGYPSDRITINGKRKRVAVHRLVAAKHLPPRPFSRHEIRHLDGNKDNPSAGNLAWGTSKENAEDRDRHGRTCRGSSHHKAKISEADVRVIRERTKDGGYSAIAKEFGLDKTTVRAIALGKIWRSVA